MPDTPRSSDAARRAQAVACVHQALAALQEWWEHIEITVANNADMTVEGYSLTFPCDDGDDSEDGDDT